MNQDIETASYYELVSWCRLFGLDESGDRTAIVQRLENFFKIKSAAGQKEILKTIDIKSARSSEYFTLEDIKEDYVIIQGHVTIVLTDKKTNAQHTIQAERILYNQTTDTLSASGGVVYKRKIGDKEESFTGETFVFDAANWEGVLYYAAGERSKKMDDQNVMFHYSGETVTRLKDDSILLEKGVITSSPDPAHPNYRITADRIWVYSPGEWAIQNAVLYLGNIPILYLPFYYYTSEELFFNPVYGFKLREGAFWQNTIYFIGKKKREDDALSFMQLEEAGDQDVEMRLHGLFLEPVRKPQGGTAAAATPPAAGQKTAVIKQLKAFLDLYSRLGVFAGVNLDASPDITLNGGLAVSRTIYQNGSAYTVFDGGGDYHLNLGNFFGLQVPFRFGLETQFKTNWGIIQRIEGNVSFFSDPTFPVDFYDREENQDWGKIIGFEIPSTTTSTTPTVVNTQRNTLSWAFTSAFNFAQPLNSKLFQTLRIDPFNFSFDWASTVNTSGISTYDPAYRFYYPQRITFPNFALVANGIIADYSHSSQVTAAPKPAASTPPGPNAVTGSPDIAQPFLPPDEKREETAPLPDYFGLRRPEAKPDAPVNRTIKYFSFRLFYAINQQVKAEHLFANDPLTLQDVENVAYYTKNSTFNNIGTTTLNYELIFWESLKIAGGLSLAQQYQVSYTPFQGFDQADADKLFTKLDLINSLQVVYNPFKAIPEFQSTELSYNLKWDFYNIAFKTTPILDYRENALLFDRTTVTLHQAIANLVFQPEDKSNNLKLTVNIPPYIGDYRGELNFYLWIFQTSAFAEYKQLADDSWLFAPVRLTETAALDPILLLSTTLNHDQVGTVVNDWWSGTASLFKYKYLNADHFLAVQDIRYNFTPNVNEIDLFRTTVDLWNLKVVFLAERMQPLTALGNPKASESVHLVPHTLDISYNLNLPEIYGWKNRISFSTVVATNLKFDFQKVIDSKFTLHLELIMKVYQFMDFSLSVDVYNNNVYRYIPAFVDAVNNDPQAPPGLNISPLNPLEDLLRSFNFFNIEDRYNSFFKLKTLAFNITHYLDDWVLKIGFTGSFQFTTNNTYEWIPALTFSLKWVPIPQFKKEFTGDNVGLKL
ncbi:MAG: LPS-assembly protein LptD [Spirochaetales bacterium]|nr:LPS-assembly protein LptD [Spirochaetales bacterium]